MPNKAISLSEMEEDAVQNYRELTSAVFARYQESHISQEALAGLNSTGTVQRVLYDALGTKFGNWLSIVNRLGLKVILVDKNESAIPIEREKLQSIAAFADSLAESVREIMQSTDV